MPETVYKKLFGTPERVAVTFATMGEWQKKEMARIGEPDDGCVWFIDTPYWIIGETFQANIGETAAGMLEWLMGDAE